VISASSFWILFAEVVSCFALKDFESRSLAFRSDEAAEDVWADPAVGADPDVDPAEPFTDAILIRSIDPYLVLVAADDADALLN
jgi:hypothetical protein